MRRTWILIGLASFFALMSLVFLFSHPAKGRIFITWDPFDPLADLLEPLAEEQLVRLSPYELGHQLPGLNGMAFVFGSQANVFGKMASRSGYQPLYAATLVIAVNLDSAYAGAIDGWQSLLDSGAAVLIPDQGTESGRLAAIALARGLGAETGNLAPALEAYRQLALQGRLNPRDEYASSEFRNVYQPHRPAYFDAVILWDYQARALMRQTGRWELVMPLEGTVTIDCGYVYGGQAASQGLLRTVRDFLESAKGKETLLSAGLMPLGATTDLSGWDHARLLFNPSFRRIVRQEKLHAPASVRERLLLGSITLLFFCIASQLVIMRVPRGLSRSSSFIALLFVLIWLLAGIMKTLALRDDFTRYFWFSSYIARHALPLAWCCMCHVHVYSRLPPRKYLLVMSSAAFLLTLLVLTNDWHRQVFMYTLPDPRTWEHQYRNGWGYYLSLFWSFALSFAGLILLFREKMTWQQKRQYLYAGLLFLLLVVYQLIYMMGMVYIIDLDIPTTVGIFIMLFILASQRERFMGALLLALPTFQKTAHGMAVYDREGRIVYHNQVMDSLEMQPLTSEGQVAAGNIQIGEKVYRTQTYAFSGGKALLLEDITDLMHLEQALAENQNKLAAVSKLLLQRTIKAPEQMGRLEHERYTRRIGSLFREKLADARNALDQIKEDQDDLHDKLRQVRLMIMICQHRLRFIIASLGADQAVPADLLIGYGEGLMKSGRAAGLDGVFTAKTTDQYPVSIASAVMDALDCLCLSVLACPGTSLVCRLEGDPSGSVLLAFIAIDAKGVEPADDFPVTGLLQALSRLAGQIEHKNMPDGVSVKMVFFKGEDAA